jgi:hypothetical protein
MPHDQHKHKHDDLSVRLPPCRPSLEQQTAHPSDTGVSKEKLADLPNPAWRIAGESAQWCKGVSCRVVAAVVTELPSGRGAGIFHTFMLLRFFSRFVPTHSMPTSPYVALSLSASFDLQNPSPVFFCLATRPA